MSFGVVYIAQYRHSAVALESQRAEVMDLLNADLQRKGIAPVSWQNLFFSACLSV